MFNAMEVIWRGSGGLRTIGVLGVGLKCATVSIVGGALATTLANVGA